jgi:hypothetical protein
VNTERLHAIANALKDEMASTNTAAKVEELAQSLRQAVDQPNDPAHQHRVSSLRTELDEALAEAPSNGFSPAWRDALEELCVADLVGDRLLGQIEQIFDRNEITPSIAADEMDPIAGRVGKLDSALDDLLSSFAFFEIGAEHLKPGQFEIGFLIPRKQVHDDLEELGKEFVELTRILGPFLEIATGSRGEVRVRSISSSAFGAFLESTPAMALIVATVLERLITAYEKVMNIRVAHQTLKEAKAKDKVLKEVAAEAEASMSNDIKAIVKDLLAEANDVEGGRANELRKELTMSLNALANRIDQGYTVEVRAPELSPVEDEDEDSETAGEDQEIRDTTEKVLAKQESLKFANNTGETILKLPEPTDERGSTPLAS